jgi:hypothetical protein
MVADLADITDFDVHSAGRPAATACNLNVKPSSPRGGARFDGNLHFGPGRPAAGVRRPEQNAQRPAFFGGELEPARVMRREPVAPEPHRGDRAAPQRLVGRPQGTGGVVRADDNHSPKVNAPCRKGGRVKLAVSFDDHDGAGRSTCGARQHRGNRLSAAARAAIE